MIAPVPADPRRILLRAVVKLMLSALLLGLIVVMSRAFLAHKEAHVEPLHIKVGQLEAGASQGVEWQKRRFLVVRPGVAKKYLVVLDYDPLYGCPLLWSKAGDPSAPQQPWHGGLRAICTDHWFDPQGHSLTPDIPDLKVHSYQLEGDDTLLVAPSPR